MVPPYETGNNSVSDDLPLCGVEIYSTREPDFTLRTPVLENNTENTWNSGPERFSEVLVEGNLQCAPGLKVASVPCSLHHRFIMVKRLAACPPGVLGARHGLYESQWPTEGAQIFGE